MLADKIDQVMGNLIDALTIDVTGVDAADEEALDEYGENSWFAEHDQQEEMVFNKKVSELFLKISQDLKTLIGGQTEVKQDYLISLISLILKLLYS